MQLTEVFLALLQGLVFVSGRLSDFTRAQLQVEFDAYENDCPGFNARELVGPNIPWSVPQRAWLTLPRGLVIAPSTIPGSGMGVISHTFIRAWTWMGEFEGEIIPPDNITEVSWYTWTLYRNGLVSHYVDGHRLEVSSWHRYVNCPRRKVEENVVTAECRGKMYYLTSKDIYPGQELLVFYGAVYAKTLNIDPTEFGDGP